LVRFSVFQLNYSQRLVCDLLGVSAPKIKSYWAHITLCWTHELFVRFGGFQEPFVVFQEWKVHTFCRFFVWRRFVRLSIWFQFVKLQEFHNAPTITNC
jgi:hypothetical protein